MTQNNHTTPGSSNDIDESTESIFDQILTVRSHGERMLMGALYYAHHGIPVFPFWIPREGADQGRKIPCVKDWPNAATTDTKQIMAWWRADAKYCGSLIGAVTGERSGSGVLDVDVKHGGQGMQSLATLADELDPITSSGLTFGSLAPEHRLAPTGLVETRSGGYHLWYPLGKYVSVKSVNQIRGLPDIEFKATGNYVAVAPSDGYTWLKLPPVHTDGTVDEYLTSQSAIDEKLLARVTEKAPSGEGSGGKNGSDTGGKVDLPRYLSQGIPMGDQDNTLRSIAASLAGRRFLEHEIVATLKAAIAVSDQDPSDPWTDKHLEDKARRAVEFIARERQKEAVTITAAMAWARQQALTTKGAWL